MTTNEYIFDDHEQDQELMRLRMIEELFDPATIAHLEQAGIRMGWGCLELGAGAGSIMKWMGSVVGASGSVVGVDKNANHLQNLSDPPFKVVEGDFLEVRLAHTFDLAHCRYVLIHNRNGDEMLPKTLQSPSSRVGFLSSKNQTSRRPNCSTTTPTMLSND